MSPSAAALRTTLEPADSPDAGSPDEAELSGRDRRIYRRMTLSELAWLDHVRLKYGPKVNLIDLSTGGAQIETNYRLQPGSTVVVQIAGPEGEIALPSRVLRCHVSGVGEQTTYRGALSFKRPLEPARRREQRGATVATNLLHEHGRIVLALRQLADDNAAPDSRSRRLSEAGEAALAATLATAQSHVAQRAGTVFRRHLTQAFRLVARGVETQANPADVIAPLTERLRRAVPAQSIRVVESPSLVAVGSADTIYFDVPVPDRPVRLLVEFPNDCRLEEWHLHFLKASVQLIALAIEAARLHTSQADTELPPASHGWQRIVARYLDGRVLKGYSRTFAPERGYVMVAPQPDTPRSAQASVPLHQLKAVFLVHDLDGAPAELPPTPASGGRRLAVTFADGEVLNGTTLNYTADGPGFFVWPSEGGNNVRVFAVNAAILHVQFL